MIRTATLLVLLTGPAEGHQAFAGWSYAAECCSDRDCREIDDSAVQAVPGGWLIKATHEVWPYRSVRPSQDGRFHRCSRAGDEGSETLCLYVPPMGQ